MKTKIAVYAVIFFITSLLTTSCQRDLTDLDSTFSHVRKCMDVSPDSALNILKAIPHPEKLSGRSQADYALLMTQAMDKNYMKFDSDSLIQVALNYYMIDQRDPAMFAKVQFYYGRVLVELDKQEDALKFFLAAKDFYDNTHEYKMLALISDEIGMINRKQGLYKDALGKFQESLNLYGKVKDSICIVRAYQNIARVYLFESKWDSCYFYFKSALDVAEKGAYTSVASILHELGILYRQKGDLSKSESYFLSSLEKETNSSKLYLGYLSLGYLYLQMNNWESARKYLEKSVLSPSIDTRKNAYDCLYWLEKEQGRFQTAIKYIEKADSLSAVIREQNSQALILDLQKKYGNEKLQRENLQIRIKYINAIGISFFVIIFVSSFVYYYYRKNRDNRKRISEIEWKIKCNEVEIERYKHELAKIENSQRSKDQKLIQNRNKIGELNGKIMILTLQNKSLSEQLYDKGKEVIIDSVSDQYIPSFRLLLTMREGYLKKKLSEKDRIDLFMLFDLLYLNYISRLKDLNDSLTKHDLEICCLLKFGFNNEDMARIFLTSSDSVTKAKGRLKGRLGLSAGDDLEAFLRRF